MITGSRQQESPTPSSTLPTRRWRSTGRSRSSRPRYRRRTRLIRRLGDVTPLESKQTLIIGAGGQLGRALIPAFPSAIPITRSSLELGSPESIKGFDFTPYGVVINAAAYTKVDAAESEAGRREAWAVNVAGVGALVEAAREHRFTLVHISSDYVFDGSQTPHAETRTVLTTRCLRADQGGR